MYYENRKIHYDKKGYAIISLEGKEIKLHIHIWEKHNGKKPKGYDIHHINGDKSNFELSNLMLLTKSDHSRIHSGWVMSNGQWTHKPCNRCKEVYELSNFYKLKNRYAAICKKCDDLRNKDEKRALQIKNHKHEWYIKNKKSKVEDAC
jgi:hypothetical protein